jgi:pectinesterase
MKYLHILLAAFPLVSRVQGATKEARNGIFRTSPPSHCQVVGSSATHKTISSALRVLGNSSAPACIFINSGTYDEQFTINYNGPLTIYGSTPDSKDYRSNTVNIVHTIRSADAGSLVKSATVNIVASQLRMYNINIKNGFGKGSQAVA